MLPAPENLLLPRPRSVEPAPGVLALGERLGVSSELAPEATRRVLAALERGLARAGVAVAGVGVTQVERDAASLVLISSPDLPDQAYRLRVGVARITLEAGDAAGAFYGTCTLLQWIRLHQRDVPVQLPALIVDDAPSFEQRGVMLDVSRNKVPQLETLYALIDLLASWKINHLELYTEHTFAYRGHERVWSGWSPLTSEDVRALDVYCRDRFVELVPNQNSFGHLHHWLRHPRYRPLAECPQGIQHPFSPQDEPFSLCPLDAGSLALLSDLYDQLLPSFTSTRFNVGCDETFDVGRGRSAAAVAERGMGAVYLDYLRGVHRLTTERGRQMLYWADIAAQHPEIVPELPADAVALEWGYEADHPFDQRLARLREGDREVWVCPGTSSWCSFVGRIANARGNLVSAARSGLAAGARGYLITDWGDYGHLQPPFVSLPGLVIGVGCAWNANATPPDDASLAALLEQWALPEGASALDLGALVVALGGIYRLPGPTPINRSILFQILHRADLPFAGGALDQLDAAGLESAAQALDGVLGKLPSSSLPAELGLLVREMRWATAITVTAAKLGRARLAAGPSVASPDLPSSQRRALVRELLERDAELPALWLARFRPGGLIESRRWLWRFRRALDPSGEDLATLARETPASPVL